MALSSTPESSASPAARAVVIRDQLPQGGLFANQHWRISPYPFSLGTALAAEIEALGRVLLQFNRALNLLYRQSAAGRQPAWIAGCLDQGKPSWLIDLQRHNSLKNELPRVIRPDLLLTDSGLRLTELDSVPGGIGLTAWLIRTYSKLASHGAAAQLLGGPEGMLRGFASLFGDAPRVHIIVSDECGAYRPEMEWLANQLGPDRFAVRSPSFTGWNPGDAAYRFFELFDASNLPCAKPLFAAAAAGELHLTPPPKPFFEEKLALALLWNRNLRDFWRQELGEAFFNRLRELVPYTWIVDPAPIPPHAAIPELGLTRWDQLKSLSQRERELILKISGFSEKAWGARGVHLGSDLSQADWAAATDAALNDFPQSPWILQRYYKPVAVESTWHNAESNQIDPMRARARLCPYYFVAGDIHSARPSLGGVLATLCPADKKIIHGMRDAILVPCAS